MRKGCADTPVIGHRFGELEPPLDHSSAVGHARDRTATAAASVPSGAPDQRRCTHAPSARPNSSSSSSSCCSSSGPSGCPGSGRQLGSGMREFKDSITGKDEDDDATTTTPDAPRPPPSSTAPAQADALDPPARRDPRRPRAAATSPRTRRRARPQLGLARPPARRPRGPAQPRRAPRRAAHPDHPRASSSSSLAFSLCYWQNDRILDIVNQPLDRAHHVDCEKPRQGRRPARASGCFDQAVGRLPQGGRPGAGADAAQRSARSPPSAGVATAARAQAAASARALRAAAAQAARAAALTPKATGPPAGHARRHRAVPDDVHRRRPTPRCCSRCRSCSGRSTRSSCRRSPARSGASRCR